MRAKISILQADLIRAEYAKGGVSQRSLAKKYGISQMAVWQILTGRTYQPPKVAS